MNLGTHGSGRECPTWKVVVIGIVGLAILLLCCSPMYAQTRPMSRAYFIRKADSIRYNSRQYNRFVIKMQMCKNNTEEAKMQDSCNKYWVKLRGLK